MSNTNGYLEQLADNIGPRPVASDTEREAAEWIRERFTEHGLTTEIEDFDTIRGTGGAYGIYYGVLVAATILLGFTQKWPLLLWVLWVILALVAVLAFFDFSDRGALSKVFPKGPSQNVIGRYAPLVRPGEERTKVIFVAHYDTALSSPLTGESVAKVGHVLTTIGQIIVRVMPIAALVMTLPLKFLKGLQPWSWYVLLVLALVPFILLIDTVIRGIGHHYSPGANNNASGVAALVTLAEELVGEVNPAGGVPSEGGTHFATGMSRPVSSAAPLDMQPTTIPEYDDSRLGALQFETMEFGALPTEGRSRRSVSAEPESSHYAAFDTYDAQSTFSDESDSGPDSYITQSEGVLGADVIGGVSSTPASQATGSFTLSPRASHTSFTSSSAPVESASADYPAGSPDYGASDDEFAAFASAAPMTDMPRSARKKGGLFSRKKKNKESAAGEFDNDNPAEWLGLSDEFSARDEGRKIGSWDNFGDDDDGLNWKGGEAQGDLIEDEEYAAQQAARIRRKVSELDDVGLSNKEVWFVATSATDAHHNGIRTFLNDYHEELRGAFIINLESLGAGDLYWSTLESAGGATKKSSARLVSLARRVARSGEWRAKAYNGKLKTDAGWVLADGRKALSMLRLDSSGKPFAAASSQDVSSRISADKIDEAVAFVLSVFSGI